MLITYQKRNGEIFDRIRNTYFPYRVGDTTSMGWKVLDIRHKYKNKYVSTTEYDRLIDKEWNKAKRRNQVKHKIKYYYQNINHIMIFLILLRVFLIVSLKAI